MATILEVAIEAGVSPSTVSNVLNGRHDRMRAETRQRVLDAIALLKFAPNAAARQLKSGLSTALGLITPSTANPFWGAIAHHVEAAARRSGYRLLICNAERDPALEVRYAETMLESGIGGVILGSSPLDFEHLRGVMERGLKIAAFDARGSDSDGAVACGVSVNQEMGGLLVAQHLIGLGHRRLGIVSGPIRTGSRIGRVNGMRTALGRAGLELPDELVWQGGDFSGFGDMEGAKLGRIGVRELLSLDSAPTAVFCANDMYALGAYAGARDLGYQVPRDLSIVGFDDIFMAELVQPPLTTIRQPVASMSEQIVRLLIDAVKEQPAKREAAFVSVKPQLIVRGSTGPAPEREIK